MKTYIKLDNETLRVSETFEKIQDVSIKDLKSMQKRLEKTMIRNLAKFDKERNKLQSTLDGVIANIKRAKKLGIK